MTGMVIIMTDAWEMGRELDLPAGFICFFPSLSPAPYLTSPFPIPPFLLPPSLLPQPFVVPVVPALEP